MHSHSVNKLNGVTLWHDFEVATAKVGTIRQNYNVIGEVNLRVKAKGFTHTLVMQKNYIMSVLGKEHHVKNSSVYSANVIFSDDSFLLPD